MKIYVIGPAGSGKTTIAKQLSASLDIPHTDLDDIFWVNQKNSFGIRRDEKIRNEMYENILCQKTWIIEGAYLSWPSNSFRLADKLVFLDIRNNILIFRILKRFIKRKLGYENCKKKETLEGMAKLLKWNKNQAIKMKKYFQVNRENYPNLVCLSNSRQINQFLEEVTI